MINFPYKTNIMFENKLYNVEFTVVKSIMYSTTYNAKIDKLGDYTFEFIDK